jgi:hypothetical protein
MLAQQMASGGQVQATTYRICIQGWGTERVGSALEGMRLATGAIASLLTREIRYQSELYGLLEQLRDSGLEFVGVRPRLTRGTT